MKSVVHFCQDDFGAGTDENEQLRNALSEMEVDFKRKAQEESRRRQKAETDLGRERAENERLRKEREQYLAELKNTKAENERLRKERERYLAELKNTKAENERLRKERERYLGELKNTKAENERLRKERKQYLAELKDAKEEKSKLVKRVENCEDKIKEFQAKVSELEAKESEAKSNQEELRRKLQREREQTGKNAEKWQKEKEETILRMQARVAFSKFTKSELREATNNFDESRIIGEGAYGKVYKGFLRCTVVAIKMLNAESLQGGAEFSQEVDILSRVRHPNLVTLIGACPEVRALVYEFLPKKSLEHRLTRKDRRLTWQARLRIAREICAGLIFLHSTKPQCIVHGDLKPENILLDANYVSKLGDFGLCRLLDQSSTTTTAYHQTDYPKGTFAYMDPEYLSSGVLTPQYDIYSFGVVLLQLITGVGPRKIRDEVREALQKGCLKVLLDASAGEWPFKEEAEELAYLGVRCCDPEGRNRPELAEVWRMLDSMKN